MMGENKMINELKQELVSIETRKEQIQALVKELPYLDSRKQEVEVLLQFMEVRTQQAAAKRDLIEAASDATPWEVITARQAAPVLSIDDVIAAGTAILQTGGPVHVLDDLIDKLKKKSQLTGREADVQDLIRRLEVKVQTKRDWPMSDRFRSP
jgi:septum formation inhibitor MinC